MIMLWAPITLAVLVGAIACFIGGWLAPELVALAGYGSPALLTLMGLYVLARALLLSGALDRLRKLLGSPRYRTPSQLIALLALVVAPAASLLVGSSRRDLRLRQRFNATVLAAKRTGATLRDRLGRLVMCEADLLLIQAPLDALRSQQQSSDLVVLDQLDADLPTTHRKHLEVAVMAAVLLLSGLGVMPLVAAVLLAAGVLVLGDCLDAGSTLRAISWDIITTARRPLSSSAAERPDRPRRPQPAIHRWPAYSALVAVYSFTPLATELLSNAAAVTLLLPIAASQSFLSPIGYQASLMLSGPGRYRFLDVPRYGWPLSLFYTFTVPALVLWWAPS